MRFGKGTEEPKGERPNADEEDNDEDSDRPHWRMLAGPKILPVAADGGREEEVLQNDSDEEPLEFT